MREINLLPPHRRLSLRREIVLVSIMQFVNSLVMAAGVVTVGALTTLILLWIVAYTSSQTTDTELSSALEKYRDQRDIIAAQNLFLTRVHTEGQRRIVWSEFLGDFFGVVPPGVDIGAIAAETTTAEAGERTTFVFSGHAVSRSTLTVFEDRLRLLEGVAAIDAPTSNITRRDNPLYRFTLTLGDNSSQEQK